MKVRPDFPALSPESLLPGRWAYLFRSFHRDGKGADDQNRIGLCVLRAICGLGLAVASPAGFGIVGVTFKYEPQKTIAFSAFGLGAPLGAACGTLIGGAIAATGE